MSAEIAARLAELARRGLLDGIAAICAAYHCTPEDVLRRTRIAHIVQARHAIWATLRGIAMLGRPLLSYQAIAELFGVDHRTVMHGIGRHAERCSVAPVCETDPVCDPPVCYDGQNEIAPATFTRPRGSPAVGGPTPNE